MIEVTRSALLRGMLASAVVIPSAAYAAAAAERDTREPDIENTLLRTGHRSGGRPLGFTIIGDNTAFGRPGVFDQAMVQVSWLRPDFVLSVGDLIEGYHEDRGVIDKQWTDVERSIAKLHCPFVFCVGNHDVNNNATLEAWNRRRGPMYYSFTHKNALFIVISTEDPGIAIPPKAIAPYYSMVELMRTDPAKAMAQMDSFIQTPEIASAKDASNVVNISDRQVGWVQDTLKRNPKPQWTFVVMHKPAWKLHSAQFAKIQAMLAGRPHTVIAGHTHYFTHEVFDGHDYINMATCGGIRQRPGPGNIDHIVNVTLAAEGPLYANMRLTGLMNVAGETGQTLAYG